MNAVICYLITFAPITVIAIWALIYVFRIFRRITKDYDKIQETKEKVDNLPCDSHVKNIDSILSHQNSFKNEIGEVKTSVFSMREKMGGHGEDIVKITTSIDYIRQIMDTFIQNSQKSNKGTKKRLTQTQSPLSITKYGYGIMEKLGIYEMIDANWSNICYYIEENLKSKNPYDIQQFLIESIAVFPDKFLKNNDLNTVKLEAYKEGRLYFHI
ncbi:hypothetical protein EZS27_023617 [termite gut metagenome]|uniref:Uncharacterized protein n=1 Tax=termite gut metagenome TaxID=433724 RepID=A0A5J4R236_9ZZZZ